MSAPMLASDANNPNFVGAHNPDSALVVKFYSKAVHQPFESAKQGRPIYADVDYIMIFTPGNQLNIVDVPARNDHKQRFAQQYAAFKAGQGDGSEAGTPVNQWPFLSASQAEEFRAMKFFTVEQLANGSDLQMQSLGMVGGMNPLMIRERARAFLNIAAGNAPAEAQAQENADLREQLANMQKQIQSMISGGIAEPKAVEPKAEKPKKEKKEKRELSPEVRAAAAERMRKYHADKAAAKAAQPQG